MKIKSIIQNNPLKTVLCATLGLQGIIVCIALGWYTYESQEGGVILPGESTPHVAQPIPSGTELRARLDSRALAPHQGVQPLLEESAARHFVPKAHPQDDLKGDDTPPEATMPQQNEQQLVSPSPVRIVRHIISSGETLTTIWKKYGAPYTGAIAAADAFKQVGVSLKALKVGETLELQVDGSSEITGLKLLLSQRQYLLLDGNSLEGYSGSLIKPDIVEKERIISGVITSSFATAAEAQDIPYAVVDDVVDIFGGKMSFRRDLQEGDSFTLIYTERQTEEGKQLEPGALRAASIKNQGKLLVAVRHLDSKGKEHFYDETGEPMGNFFLRYPLKFTRISSVFSTSRFHPVLKRRRPHNGVDFAAPVGTPVRAVADGTITTKGYDRGGGNTIKIRHSSKYTTAYLHLSKFAKGIQRGSFVTRGQVIGYVGKTGLATGPHLHFSFYIDGKYVDPMKIELPRLPVGSDPIDKVYLAKTIKALEEAHDQIQFAQTTGIVNSYSTT